MPPGVQDAKPGLAEGHGGERAQGDAVDVLGRVDRLERGPLVDLRRDGVLQQDAVHRGVGGELADERDQFGGGGVGGQW